MTRDDEHLEIAKLRTAIRNVVEAARAEAAAFRDVPDKRVDESLKALHETHLHELNMVQALLATLEMFERRVLTGPSSASDQRPIGS